MIVWIQAPVTIYNNMYKLHGIEITVFKNPYIFYRLNFSEWVVGFLAVFFAFSDINHISRESSS